MASLLELTSPRLRSFAHFSVSNEAILLSLLVSSGTVSTNDQYSPLLKPIIAPQCAGCHAGLNLRLEVRVRAALQREISQIKNVFAHVRTPQTQTRFECQSKIRSEKSGYARFSFMEIIGLACLAERSRQLQQWF